MSIAYQQPQHQVIVSTPPSNGLGTAGFVVSLIGLIVTCGVLCPLGLLLSVFALFRRPRGMAVAGTIIGLIGSLAVASVVGMICVAMVGAQGEIGKVTTQVAFGKAIVAINNHKAKTGRQPGSIVGNKLVAGMEDGWGNSIRYEPGRGNAFVLRSAGPDAKFNSADDVLGGPGAPNGSDMSALTDLLGGGGGGGGDAGGLGGLGGLGGALGAPPKGPGGPGDVPGDMFGDLDF